MTILIGDCHGKYDRYGKLIKRYPNSIAIGDMGIGFRDWQGDYFANPPYDKMVATGARFIRGNHDNPGVCRNHTQWIKDGTIEDNVMFIGGAWSIDRAMRREDYTWWKDEELSYQELDQMIDIALDKKPEVMVTHDGPQDMMPHVFQHVNLHKDMVGTRTGQALERIRQLIKPKLWVFGHWHVDRDVTIDGTRFICLAELAPRAFDFKTFAVSRVLDPTDEIPFNEADELAGKMLGGSYKEPKPQKMLGTFNDYKGTDNE